MTSRALIYCRRSTDEKKQAGSLAYQEAECRKLARAKRLPVAGVWIDECSGTVDPDRRLGWRTLLAHLRPGDVLVVTEVSRVSRLWQFHEILHRFEAAGAKVSTVFDGDDSLVLGVKAVLAKEERTRLVERTKAGLRRAKKAGKRLGRPGIGQDVQEALRLLYESGSSGYVTAHREITGQGIQVSQSTVKRLFRQWDENT